MSPPTIRSVRSAWPAGIGLGVALTASCLLTTPLDGLEGPPLSDDGGAGDAALPGDGGAPDSADASSEIEAGSGTDTGPSDDGGNEADAPSRDADAETNRPIRVAGANGVLRGIAERGLYVYWVQTDISAGIARAPKEGVGMSVFVDTTPGAVDVAVDDDYVYWSTGPGNEVYRKSILADGASGAPYFSGPRETLYIAAGTAGMVYVTGFDSISVGPRLDAGTSEGLYPHPTQPGAAGIAVHGTDLYWSLDMGIVRGSTAGLGQKPAEPVFPAAPGEINGIATDGEDLYFIGAEGVVRAISPHNPSATPREVCRTSTETSDAESDARPAADAGTSVADIAVDDQWVYFTEPAIRQISKCRKY